MGERQHRHDGARRTGREARSVSVAPCRQAADVPTILEREVLRRPPGEWVDIGGYDQRPLGRYRTAAELDTVSAGRKVFLTHGSGHACVVNSAVLQLLPKDITPIDGMLVEGGMASAGQLRQPYSVAELVDWIDHAARTCLIQGVTAVAEAGIGGGLISHSPVELAAYPQIRDVAGPARSWMGTRPDGDRPAT